MPDLISGRVKGLRHPERAIVHVRPLEPGVDPLGYDLALDAKGHFYVEHPPPGPRLVWFTGPEVVSPTMLLYPRRDLVDFHVLRHALGDDLQLVEYGR